MLYLRLQGKFIAQLMVAHNQSELTQYVTENLTLVQGQFINYRYFCYVLRKSYGMYPIVLRQHFDQLYSQEFSSIFQVLPLIGSNHLRIVVIKVTSCISFSCLQHIFCSVTRSSFKFLLTIYSHQNNFSFVPSDRTVSLAILN